jgi:hypothetical protein
LWVGEHCRIVDLSKVTKRQNKVNRMEEKGGESLGWCKEKEEMKDGKQHMMERGGGNNEGEGHFV